VALPDGTLLAGNHRIQDLEDSAQAYTDLMLVFNTSGRYSNIFPRVGLKKLCFDFKRFRMTDLAGS
jgi:hypothetical protein